MKYKILAKAWLCSLAFLLVPAHGAEEQKPLEFELPKAYYGGTVASYWSPHLDTRVYVERPPLRAPEGTVVVSRKKPVTASSAPLLGELTQLNDGDKEFGKLSLLELPEGKQWVQIDLEEEYGIYAVLLWHFHEGSRVYFDVVGQLSNDPEFKTGVLTIYNNDYDNSLGLGAGTDKEYIENSDGRLFRPEGLRGRYIRFYSRGNSDHEFNNYVEIEVWGKIVE